MALSLRSKTGCLECRKRRVKCDETHPTCLRCRKIKRGCIWPGRSQVTPQYLQMTEAIGNSYASLFLHHGLVGFGGEEVLDLPQVCLNRQISPGYPPLRNADEHYRLIRLSAFLSALTVKHPGAKDQEDSFEFAVALAVPWVRDAMLAFAGFVNKSQDHNTILRNVFPYYSSASAAVRINVLKDLDEARLEQLLVASMFLGLLEVRVLYSLHFKTVCLQEQVSKPFNAVFPLFHFEAVGRFLEALSTIKSQKSLPATTTRFHRIATEAYLRHIAIQSLFWPQANRCVTLSSSQMASDESLEARSEINIIIKMDLSIYTILLKLSRLARFKDLDIEQRIQAEQLDKQIKAIRSSACSHLEELAVTEDRSKLSYYKITHLATNLLSILVAKVCNRSLTPSSPIIRSLFKTSLEQLEECEPRREWMGDFSWFFAILACAVYTKNEWDRFSRKLEQFSPGFWSLDLKKMQKVLYLVRAKRVQAIKANSSTMQDTEVTDTLSLLIEARLSLN